MRFSDKATRSKLLSCIFVTLRYRAFRKILIAFAPSLVPISQNLASSSYTNNDFNWENCIHHHSLLFKFNVLAVLGWCYNLVVIVKVSRTPDSETSLLYEHLLSVMSGRWVR